MTKVLIIEPNKEKDIINFAESMGISIEKAKFIDYMRSHYITWEYDYIKKPTKVLEAR